MTIDTMSTLRIMSRRRWFAISVLFAPFIKAAEPKKQKLVWKKLTNEPIQLGDFWASQDPNTPELQGQRRGYNLQLQAVHPDEFGKPAKEINIGNGAFWRPTGFVAVS